MADSFYARPGVTPRGDINPDRATWQPLLEHLGGVGRRAMVFAAKFSAGSLGQAGGLWHDFGKYTAAFQKRLNGGPRCDHSVQGAVRALSLCGADAPDAALALMLSIAGHHAGLDWPLDGGLPARKWLEQRQARAEPVIESRVPGAELEALRAAELRLPQYARNSRLSLDACGGEQPLEYEFFIRFLLSALVDADRLDAADFEGKSRGDRSDGAGPSSLRQCHEKLESRLREFSRRNEVELEPSRRRILAYRDEVLAACRARAQDALGVFTLSVATGGGKTLSSLMFALEHALRHGLDRVIVAIPYTSIIEQTANVFRDILGSENVLEHHSNVSVEDDRRGLPEPEQQRRRLATANWDAPIIVTTNVQLIESLFSSSPSTCRKLHNVARSVLILDEAQTLPLGQHEPICDALNQLTRHYGCSVVFCTATQPGLTRPKAKNAQGQTIAHVSGPVGREPIEIMPPTLPDPPERVRVEVVGSLEQAIEWRDLAQHIHARGGASCLAIVHRREDARTLALELDALRGDTETIHLSALMAPEHRSRKIVEVKARLEGGKPCMVVSTQLVEAGVDFSFPVVYRALGGIDAMTQAAGRANRNGELGELGGALRVFRAKSEPPRGTPRTGLEITRSILSDGTEPQRILSKEVCDRFFERMSRERAGGGSINRERRRLNYPQVEQDMRLIPDGGTPVVVPWPNRAAMQSLIEDARTATSSGRRLGGVLRQLQRVSVSVFDGALMALQSRGAVEPLLPANSDAPSLWVLLPSADFLYSDRFGLAPDGDSTPNVLVA